MEYLTGLTLKQIVREHGAARAGACDRGRRADPDGGAVRAQARHRAPRPQAQNVILAEDGAAKVADFGIALAGASDMTETGAIMGTAQYLSPEQAQGHPVDARSDLYSIGIVLYELLTGHRALRRGLGGDDRAQAGQRGACAPRAAQPGGAAGARLRRDAGAAEGSCGALPERGGVPRRARAGAARGACRAPAGARPGGRGRVAPRDDHRARAARRRRDRPRRVAAPRVPTTRRCPNVVGQTSASAAQVLQNRGFEVDVVPIQSDERPTGESRDRSRSRVRRPTRARRCRSRSPAGRARRRSPRSRG